MDAKHKSDEDAAIQAGIAGDADARELKGADFKRAVPVDRLSADARKAISGVRGKQVKPTKVATTIRLDAEVIEFYKAGGPGWQGRINNDLVRHVHKSGGDGGTAGGRLVKRASKDGRFISGKSKEDEKKRA